MQLENIDKNTYRTRLNRIIVACIASLAGLSLLVSQVLILIFPSESGSHFHWNLLGVIIGALLVVSVLLKFKKHPKMTEVAYVWDLKHQLNLIYRKNRKLLAEAKAGNPQAMLALQFSYAGSRQLWQLDDNSITMDSLNKAQNQLDEWVEQYGVLVDITQYREELLQQF
jgi:FtsH-binding integral membrane protein